MNLSFDIELRKKIIANADVYKEQTKFYDSNIISKENKSHFLTINCLKYKKFH